jgi:3-methyladenine DNA glycosylase AlkD
VSGTDLVDTVRAALAGAADPARAPRMQAYMKSAMPFLGVSVPEVRRLTWHAVRTQPPATTGRLVADVRRLWYEARFREERYAATALLSAPATRRLRRPELLDLHAELIVSGAWWDHVDELAHRVGELLRGFPADVRPVVAGWPHAPDRWLRRVSIICQLGARESTDLALLTAAITANADDPDFFLRKAIGWALRDYARTDPDWVRAFVAEHRLSPLSVREATKHL